RSGVTRLHSHDGGRCCEPRKANPAGRRERAARNPRLEASTAAFCLANTGCVCARYLDVDTNGGTDMNEFSPFLSVPPFVSAFLLFSSFPRRYPRCYPRKHGRRTQPSPYLRRKLATIS